MAIFLCACLALTNEVFYNNCMIDWEELRQNRWIVGVSGGCDSMALLSMCIAHHVDCIVAHVNYQKRDTAFRDMEGVKAFCKEKGIPCQTLFVESYAQKGNFQDQARAIRYRFYHDLTQFYHAYGVLIAHQKEDVIETYLLQQERNSIPSYYGIRMETVLYETRVKRILFDYTKQELETYCRTHDVPYFQDETNDSDMYARNRIRHLIIDHLTDAQKDDYIQEIQHKNEEKAKRLENIQPYKLKECFTLSDFEGIPDEFKTLVLREWIEEYGLLYHSSEKNLKLLKQQLEEKHTNFKHSLNGEYFIQCEYGRVYLDTKEDQSYAYVFKSPEEMEGFVTPYFSIRDKGEKKEGVAVEAKDFPLTIRNVKDGDRIRLRMGTKKVSRFFIDEKISHKERKTWPVVENVDGDVIFVSGIGCDIEHYSNNFTFFVLK